MTVPLVKPQNGVGSGKVGIKEKGMMVGGKEDEEYLL